MSKPSVRPLLRTIYRAIKWDGFWWTAGITAVLVIGVFLSWLLWEELRGEQESLSMTVRNLGFVIGGTIAILIAVWRSVVAERQADTAQRQAEMAQRQVETAERQVETAERQAETEHQSLLNDRYRRESDMLDSDVLTVRQDAVDALQSLAADYAEHYHVRIMRRLCAFVRNLTGNRDGEVKRSAAESPSPTASPVRDDVLAGMKALGYRDEARIALEKEANFLLDLRGVDLRGMSLGGANLSNALLTEADLSGADLSHAVLTEADLSGAVLSQADLSDALLMEAGLSGAVLSQADLSDTLLMEADLSGANLSRADLSDAGLMDAGLSDADLTEADLSDADLTEADLSGADLSGANLSDADFSQALLSGVDFSGDSGLPARGLVQAQLDEARADPSNPPNLDGVLDTETGEPLVWRSKPLTDGS